MYMYMYVSLMPLYSLVHSGHHHSQLGRFFIPISQLALNQIYGARVTKACENIQMYSHLNCSATIEDKHRVA